MSEPKTEPACILLTGATGFLGAFLLRDLLQQTQAEIYCLVRSADSESAKKRIQSSLESYLIWDESSKELLGKTFHLVNPQSFQMSELLGWICSMGYPIKQVSSEAWQAEIINRAGYSPENALYPLVGLFSEKVSDAEMAKSATLQFDCQNALKGLSGTDIICPQADASLFRTYFSYLVDRQLIEAPKYLV